MEPPLTTVDRVQRSNGMSGANPLLLDDLIREASDELAQACGRSFSRAAGVVERVPGYGTPWLVLRDVLPIVSIDSIQFDDGNGNLTTIAATDYALADGEAGTIRRIGADWDWTANPGDDITGDPQAGTERAAFVVTYAGGWVSRWQDDTSALGPSTPSRDLPWDIEGAIVDQVVTAFRKSGKDATISSKRIQSVATSYGAASAGDASVPAHWSPKFAAAVARYRR